MHLQSRTVLQGHSFTQVQTFDNQHFKKNDCQKQRSE